MQLVSLLIVLSAICVYKILEHAEYNLSFAIWFNMLIGTMYFALSIFFAYVDITRQPAYIYKLKLQKDACLHIDEYKEVFKRTFLKYIFVVAPMFILVLFLLQHRYSMQHVDLSSPVYWVASLFICYAITDFAAWFIHKALHYFPWLWDNVHSIHHKHIAPVAVSAFDAHPIELIIWDILPFAIGPLLLGVNAAFFTMFSVIAIMNTVICHSGYDINYDKGHHDLHHERLKCNYSGIVSDTVMGTCIERKDIIYPRFDSLQKDLFDSYNKSCSTLGNYSRV